MATEPDRRVNPEGIAAKFEKYFGGKSFTSTLVSVLDSQEYKAWKRARNILTHRAQPGRAYFTGGEKDGQTLWLAGEISIDEVTTSSRKRGLSDAISRLVGCAASFCDLNAFP